MRGLEGFYRGINLGGWLSQCDHTKDTYDNFIKEEDIDVIGTWGLDHVRLPVDYDLILNDDYSFREDGFKYIDNAVAWCTKNGLNMVLDLHKTCGYSFDHLENEEGFFESEKYQEIFYNIWEEFSRRYGNNDRIIFELLNEVTKKEYCDEWNRISTECIKRIRMILPTQRIIIGGYYNNSIEALPDLAMPYDENIIYTFHCYEPLIFTHQGAYWIPSMDTSFRISLDSSYEKLNEMSGKYLDQVTVGFDGMDKDSSLTSEYFFRLFAEAVKVAEERNVPLYCGEYGVIDLAAPEEALRWYSIISEAFNKFNIGRCTWSYKKMDFGISDDRFKDKLDELLKYL